MLKNSDTSSDDDIINIDKQNNQFGINAELNKDNNINSLGLPNINKDTSNEIPKDSTSTDALFNMLANPEKVQLDILNKEIATPDDVASVTSSSESSSSKKSDKSDRSKKSSTSSRSRKSNRSSKSNRSTNSPKFNEFNPSSGITNNKPTNSFVNQETIDKPNIRHTAPEPTPVPVPAPKILTAQEIRMKKIDLLRKLSELKIKGYTLTKEYNFESSIEEMEYEYDLLKSYADKQNGVKLFKSFLLNGISAIEFLNERYDPFSFKLSGWTEHVSCEVDSWEDIMAEIYEKYKGNGKKMEPEIKLALLLLASGGQFHASNSLSSLPQVEQILKKNPGLVNKIINQQNQSKSNFMSPQEINLENIKKQEREKQEQIRKKQKEMMERRANTYDTSVTNSTIKGPVGVDKLLGEINKVNNQMSDNDDKTDNDDRLLSDSTLNTDTMNSSKKKGRPIKKSSISIST